MNRIYLKKIYTCNIIHVIIVILIIISFIKNDCTSSTSPFLESPFQAFPIIFLVSGSYLPPYALSAYSLLYQPTLSSNWRKNCKVFKINLVYKSTQMQSSATELKFCISFEQSWWMIIKTKQTKKTLKKLCETNGYEKDKAICFWFVPLEGHQIEQKSISEAINHIKHKYYHRAME